MQGFQKYEVGDRVTIVGHDKSGELVEVRPFRVRLDEGRQELPVSSHEIRPEEALRPA
jgi:hypothetical protein